MQQNFDCVIRNGTVVDGSGRPAVKADIAIQDGRIAAIGQVPQTGTREIDATGKTVTPGFVDIHTHYDAQVFWDRTLSPSSYCGVTTIVGGNCGFSIAPLTGDPTDAEYLMRMLAQVEGMPLESLRRSVPWDWKSFGDFLNRIDGTLPVNSAFMVGHSALRRAVMHERATRDQATPEEIEAMKALLRKSLSEGGMGFSTSQGPTHNDGDRSPVPSRFATTEEMLALAGVVAEFEGTTIEYSPDTYKWMEPELTDLMVRLSLAAGRPLNWNILHPDSKTPELVKAQLGASRAAQERGARVVPLASAQVNLMWTNFISCGLIDALPGWQDLVQSSVPDRMKALRDPATRARLKEGAQSPGAQRALGQLSSWGEWTLAEVYSDRYRKYMGKKVKEAAAAEGLDAFDMMIEIVLADELRTSLGTPPRAADEDSWKLRGEVWASPYTLIGASDAGAHLDMIDSFSSPLQVLAQGVRERKLITMEAAIAKLCSGPAKLYGIKDRGELREGAWADILVFDSGKIGRGPLTTRTDLPGGAGRLYAEATGIHHVLVNGQETFRNGTFTNRYPGRMIRSGTDTYTVPIGAAAAAAA